MYIIENTMADVTLSTITLSTLRNHTDNRYTSYVMHVMPWKTLAGPLERETLLIGSACNRVIMYRARTMEMQERERLASFWILEKEGEGEEVNPIKKIFHYSP